MGDGRRQHHGLVGRALRRHPCAAHRRYRPDLGRVATARVAAGVRRIEALTGTAARKAARRRRRSSLKAAAAALKAPLDELPARARGAARRAPQARARARPTRGRSSRMGGGAQAGGGDGVRTVGDVKLLGARGLRHRPQGSEEPRRRGQEAARLRRRRHRRRHRGRQGRRRRRRHRRSDRALQRRRPGAQGRRGARRQGRRRPARHGAGRRPRRLQGRAALAAIAAALGSWLDASASTAASRRNCARDAGDARADRPDLGDAVYEILERAVPATASASSSTG